MDFNSVLIGSEDPDKLVAYYTKLFGDPTFSEGGYTGWEIGSGTITICPHSEVHGRSLQPGRILLNIGSTDVKGDFERFKAAGATVVAEPYVFEDVPGQIATFEDPDGNYFQLMSPMEPNQPG